MRGLFLSRNILDIGKRADFKILVLLSVLVG